ncbi:MAG: YqcC family protein [Paraglaciecola sp.]|uniref:YqcC family protein n=1 Tax=Pseudomonadati TaxID=3379134 RepID=UPI00273E681C|nr:YqcC family protein [Paraglaciecola sp.]MDP5031459.1 YqcC family protein [Paraglaciecola sp.]MDP5130804.1 YqcC family protein [Paraglaciecola sp.]
MPRSVVEVEAQLQQLEFVLRKAGLWSMQQPSLEALQSAAPFACDKMPFEHWLQFIFIPQLTIYLRSDKPLPNTMGLYPMGEQCFSESSSRELVLPVLAQIDKIFNQ